MPKDVPLGEGYSGAALMAGFPGQYRDPQTEVQTFDTSGYYASYPGAAAGHPTATDPDQGRQLVIQDIPGVGQVVVPVEHSVAAVYPSDHYMAGAQPNGGQGDWYGSMFGMSGISAEIAQIAAGEQLDKFNSGMAQLQNNMVASYAMLDAIEGTLQSTGRALTEADNWATVNGARVPTAVFVRNNQIMAAAMEGYKALVGFDFVLQAMRQTFEANQTAIMKTGYPINAVLIAINNFNSTMATRVYARNDAMKNLFLKMTDTQSRIFKTGTGRFISGSDIKDNPDYLNSAKLAVQDVLGLKLDETMSGLGAAFLAVIGIIFIVLAIFAICATALSLASKYTNDRQGERNLLQQQATLREQKRQELKKSLVADGSSQSEAEKRSLEWSEDDSKKESERNSKRAQNSGSPFGDIAGTVKAVAIGAAVVAGAFVFGPMISKLF